MKTTHIIFALLLTYSTTAAANPNQKITATGRYHLSEKGYETSWPGVYFETHFSGTQIGVELKGGHDHYNVEIDDKFMRVISDKSGNIEWFEVPNGKHAIRISKRTESHDKKAIFTGFVTGKNSTLIAPPPKKTRQIEIIGDSNFAGLGLESPQRKCTQEQARQYANADKTFGALTAKAFNADYHLNAYSGLGMVRNWKGNNPNVNYREFYKKTLTDNPKSHWQKPDDWNPEIILIGLGSNDFSTPINEGEKWTNATLHSEYKTAYQHFLKNLREQYGKDSLFILASQPLSETNYFGNMIAQMVKQQEKAGDRNIIHWEISDMEYTACFWHYSEEDHHTAAGQLIEMINARWAM